MAGQYQVLYLDTITGAVHGALPVEAFSFSHVLNGAGSITCRMPLDSTSTDRLTNQVAWPRIEPGKLEVDGSTLLYVLRDNVPLWSGFVWTRDVDPGANALTVSGEGFLSYFRRRLITSDLAYTASDQAGIAEDLLGWAQGRSGGDVGLNVDGSVSTGVTRDRTYVATDYKPVAEAIEQLAAVSDGFDFRFAPEWNSGTLRTTFFVQYPASGRATEIVLELGTNVNLLNERSDGTNVATTTRATGVGVGRSMRRRMAVDTSQLGTRPLLESIVSFGDISEVDTLQAHADLELIRGSEPLSHVEVELLQGMLPRIGSYLVGDRLRVKGEHGYFSVDDTYRIVEQVVSVDESGETVRLSLAPLGVFL